MKLQDIEDLIAEIKLVKIRTQIAQSATMIRRLQPLQHAVVQ
jgi:hypothetical protein